MAWPYNKVMIKKSGLVLHMHKNWRLKGRSYKPKRHPCFVVIREKKDWLRSKKLHTFIRPSVKDLANILSLFFLCRLFSGRVSFTGTVCTCRYPSLVFPILGRSRRYVADLKCENPRFFNSECKSARVVTVRRHSILHRSSAAELASTI